MEMNTKEIMKKRIKFLNSTIGLLCFYNGRKFIAKVYFYNTKNSNEFVAELVAANNLSTISAKVISEEDYDNVFYEENGQFDKDCGNSAIKALKIFGASVAGYECDEF